MSLPPNRGSRGTDLSRPRPVEPPRIRPLATLPVFVDLAGKRAVVVGGSDAAAWKAELLAAAGARVEVLAEALSDTFRALIAREGNGSPRIRHAGAFNDAAFAGAAMIVADAADDRKAAALRAAAGRSGVPINIVDRPAFSDFQFGTVVNRSPVVVGISTGGAAPILGQAIRQRIEMVLGPALGDWAALAQRLRSEVMRLLKPGTARRAFWENFARRAFGPPPDHSDGAVLAQELRFAGDRTGGRVTLVGAGPGDADLLTLKAVRALQSADVILFDDLVSDEVLELARREARRMLVGKRGGRRSCRQDDINATMIALARAGKHVVRLKSGDPAIFGRAGEEVAILRQEGIPVDIVPGITAALAMAARFGVTLTHRDFAQSVRFVTAHRRDGALPHDLDWKSLAAQTATTIFYMGGSAAAEVARRLIEEGLPPSTPVVVAAGLSRPGETCRAGHLAELAAITAELGRERPILIGVGEVFAGAGVALDWSDANSSVTHLAKARTPA